MKTLVREIEEAGGELLLLNGSLKLFAPRGIVTHDNNVEAYALCNNCTGEELGNILDELYIQKHEDRIVHC